MSTPHPVVSASVTKWKEGRLGRVVPAVSCGNGRGGGDARCPGRLLHEFTTAGSHCLRDWPVSLSSTPLPWLSLSCPPVALVIPASPLTSLCRGRRCPTLRRVYCGRRPSSPLLPVCRGRCPSPPFLAFLRCKSTHGGGRSFPASRYRHSGVQGVCTVHARGGKWSCSVHTPHSLPIQRVACIDAGRLPAARRWRFSTHNAVQWHRERFVGAVCTPVSTLREGSSQSQPDAFLVQPGRSRSASFRASRRRNRRDEGGAAAGKKTNHKESPDLDLSSESLDFFLTFSRADQA